MRSFTFVMVMIGLAAGCKSKGNSGAGSGSEDKPVAVTATAPAPAMATPGSAAAEPAPTGAPAPTPGLVELIHNAPTTLRVSSRVANKAILPAHLVDKSLNTAWNSRTGDLVGAWIDVDIPGAAISELRMTVGHTGKGIHGEDYFVMNPRIRKISVLDGKNAVATIPLDTEKRTLQVVKLAKPLAHLRIRIDEVVPGAKPSWREACVSELEAWGTLPAGAAAKDQKPRIEVGDPPDDSWMHPPIRDVNEYCNKLLKDPRDHYKEMISADQRETADCLNKPDQGQPCGDPDPPGEPNCSITTDVPVKDDFWAGAGTMQSSNDSVYGARPTQLVIQTRDGYWPVGDEIDCGSFGENGHCEMSATSARVRPKDSQLDITYHVHTWNGDHDYVMTCSPGEEVKCTAATEMTKVP